MIKRGLALALGVLLCGMPVGAKDLDLGHEGIWQIPDTWEVYSQEDGFWGKRLLEMQRSPQMQQVMMKSVQNLIGDLLPQNSEKLKLGTYISEISQSMRSYRFHVEDRRGVHTLDLVVMKLPLAETIQLSAQTKSEDAAFWKEAFLPQETESVRQYIAEKSKGKEYVQGELNKSLGMINRKQSALGLTTRAKVVSVSPLYRFGQGTDIYYEQSVNEVLYVNDIAYPSSSVMRIGKQGENLVILGWSMPLPDYEFFHEEITKINAKGGRLS